LSDSVAPDVQTISFGSDEIGVIQDIEEIGNLCRQHKIFFHVDAAQSAGKVAIDLSKLPVDLMSFIEAF
jgi:cysteine desulfurase